MTIDVDGGVHQSIQSDSSFNLCFSAKAQQSRIAQDSSNKKNEERTKGESRTIFEYELRATSYRPPAASCTIPTIYTPKMPETTSFDQTKLFEIQNVLLDVAKKAGEMITGAKPAVEGAGSKKNCNVLPPPPQHRNPLHFHMCVS